eukprot:COSAG02_NODE_8511_length_2542_cov_5.641424_4_plen_175_part_00
MRIPVAHRTDKQSRLDSVRGPELRNYVASGPLALGRVGLVVPMEGTRRRRPRKVVYFLRKPILFRLTKGIRPLCPVSRPFAQCFHTLLHLQEVRTVRLYSFCSMGLYGAEVVGVMRSLRCNLTVDPPRGRIDDRDHDAGGVESLDGKAAANLLIGLQQQSESGSDTAQLLLEDG